MDKKHAVAALVVIQLLASATTVSTAGAQVPTPAAATPQTLRVYLDCHCDFDYIRREIEFVNWVRDRQASDVHLLVTRQSTGGGDRYELHYIGEGRHAGVEDTLVYDSPSTDTEELERQGLVRTMKLGLMRFVAATPEAAGIRIAFEPPAAREAAAGPRDPWNFWNFRVALEGSLDDEARERSYDMEGSLDANRTTEAWKLNFSVDGERRTSEIELDDRTIDFETHNWEASGLVVKSLGGNWAAGVGAALESSVFQNYQLAFRLAPALEYNFYPYVESSRRALVLRYYLGMAVHDYEEETLFFKTRETLAQQALTLRYGLQQTWGEANLSAEYSNYLQNFNYNRVELDGYMSFNIVRGLSVDLGAEYERIRDQLSIPREDLSDEEVLLDRRQRLTGHRLELNLGLSYRFGSIFNNVVNPRMDRF